MKIFTGLYFIHSVHKHYSGILPGILSVRIPWEEVSLNLFENIMRDLQVYDGLLNLNTTQMPIVRR